METTNVRICFITMIAIDPGFISSPYQFNFAAHRRHGESLHIVSVPRKAIVKQMNLTDTMKNDWAIQKGFRYSNRNMLFLNRSVNTIIHHFKAPMRDNYLDDRSSLKIKLPDGSSTIPVCPFWSSLEKVLQWIFISENPMLTSHESRHRTATGKGT